MDIMGIGAGLANSSSSTAIPVLKKAMNTQETLMGQLLGGMEATAQSASSQGAVSSPEALQEAAHQMGRGISLDVNA